MAGYAPSAPADPQHAAGSAFMPSNLSLTQSVHAAPTGALPAVISPGLAAHAARLCYELLRPPRAQCAVRQAPAPLVLPTKLPRRTECAWLNPPACTLNTARRATLHGAPVMQPLAVARAPASPPSSRCSSPQHSACCISRRWLLCGCRASPSTLHNARMPHGAGHKAEQAADQRCSTQRRLASPGGPATGASRLRAARYFSSRWLLRGCDASPSSLRLPGPLLRRSWPRPAPPPTAAPAPAPPLPPPGATSALKAVPLRSPARHARTPQQNYTKPWKRQAATEITDAAYQG